MMRRVLLLVCVVVLGACGESSAGTTSATSSGTTSATSTGTPASTTTTSSAAAAPVCGPATATTLAAGREARVYVRAGTVYGCAVGGHGQYPLGRRGSCLMSASVAPVTVAGRFAAYGLQRCGVDTGSTLVIVRRLTDGARVHSAPASSPPGPEGYETVTSLVLGPNGAVAWIATGRSLGRSVSIIEVWRIDHTGARKRLDSGPAIAPASLRLRSSTLSWRHGQATRTATLR